MYRPSSPVTVTDQETCAFRRIPMVLPTSSCEDLPEYTRTHLGLGAFLGGGTLPTRSSETAVHTATASAAARTTPNDQMSSATGHPGSEADSELLRLLRRHLGDDLSDLVDQAFTRLRVRK